MTYRSVPGDGDGPRPTGVDSRAGPERVRTVSGTARTDHDAAFEALLHDAASVGDLPPAPRLPRVGDVIAGKYLIEEQLGQGGMGAVFRATHLISERQVAIKWMLRSAADEHARRRFVREARAAARIEHPNVVDVYDIGQQGDSGIYLVMQFLRGESLRTCISRDQLDLSDTVDLLLPAMRGVAAVHQAGVIHRDLKPDNIFLCEARPGATREAKVLDFGISAIAAGESHEGTLTGDGAILGTPAYMSAEQLHDSRSVDVRADVYSFGVILYETLTGALPFAADNYNGLVLAIMLGEPKNPCDLRAELPHEVGRIVLRALARQREERYPNMESLIAALLPYAGSRAGQSGERSASTQGFQPKQRLWLWVVCSSLAVLACAAWWLGQGPVRREATFSVPAPALETHRSGRQLSAPNNATLPPRASAAPAAPASPPEAPAAKVALTPPDPVAPSPAASPSSSAPATRRAQAAKRKAGVSARTHPTPSPSAPAPELPKARSGKISPEEL